ncbi:penicillin acylase family protein [Limnohabitans sp. Rim11]|uniref:penicillin acylase family protein n=1 Tax=Limnohabitans sp. Rim11 TaxID=1100719 RepID=UPI000B038919|nr:penicillin acylase family protein [Limnohabitans sp. Rim11]
MARKSVRWSQWFLRGVLALVLLALTAFGAFQIYLLRSMAPLAGEAQVMGLAAGVEVKRDASDVTHIHAKTPMDAWRAIGYVHAQERGWQLAFNRQVMHGELSEWLGTPTLETDKLMRTLGIMKAAQAQFDKLPPNTQKALEAYAEGVQAGYASAQWRAPEFVILGINPSKSMKPWTAVDSVGWALMMALDLGGNWGNEFARMMALQTLSTDDLWKLMPPYPGESRGTKVDVAALYKSLGVYAPEKSPQAQALANQQLLSSTTLDIGVLEGKGSNNWVLPGNNTKSGLPLLANDPHLGLSAPAVWYFAGLHAPAGKFSDGQTHGALDVVGATLPGLPFVVLGRTNQAAWGFTNTGPDVQDLYLEALEGKDNYRTPTGQQAFETRNEVIKVKGQGDVNIKVRTTRHGPVISDVQPAYAQFLNTDKYAIALRWTALDIDNQTIVAGMEANFANSVAELRLAFSKNHSPMQSVVMADKAGRVLFKAAGKVPVRSAANDLQGMVPAPGWLAQYDWQSWIPYDQTPEVSQADIEKRGWHATANQKILPPGYAQFLTNDWTGPERFDRIAQLLSEGSQLDAPRMKTIQADVHSLAADRLLPYMQSLTSQHAKAAEVLPILKSFKGVMNQDSAGALIYAVWIDEVTRAILIPKIGEVRFKALFGKRAFRPAVEGVLASQDKSWCGESGCQSLMNKALDTALDKIMAMQGDKVASWNWGRAHPALSVHKPFGNVKPLAAFFDVSGPSCGDAFTVNVGQYWTSSATVPFATRHAASMRAVYDLSNLDESGFIYQTGQSGNPFSPRYRDMKDEWGQVKYRPLRMSTSGPTQVLQLNP